MIAELLLKLREGHPDFTDDLRFQYFYLNRLKWTESIVQILAELEDESQILRIVRLALEVDLILGGRLAGSVQTQFQEKTVALINALEISDRERVKLLGLTLSDAAIPGLMDAIERGCYQHYEHALNIQAVRILGSFGTESTIPGLVKALQDRDFEVRESAASSLGKIGGDLVITSLLEALNHECEYVRKDIIEILGNLGAVDAVPALIYALENDSSDCRDVAAEAAKALGKLGAINAVPALTHALDDEIYYYVYINAIEALGKIGGEAAIAALTKALASDREYLQIEAAKALAKLGDTGAMSILINALKTSNNQNYLIEILGEVNSDAAISAIIEASDPNLSSSAARTLGRTENIRALKDRSDWVRDSVIEMLGELDDPMFIHELINMLSDENYSVRIRVAKSLIKFDNEIVIPALINSLTNKDWWVGYYSIEALEKFSDRTVVRDALFSIITDLVPSQPEITPEAVHTLKIRSAHALGFYNYEIEKLNIQ
jgi:HEAT repeat protein